MFSEQFSPLFTVLSEFILHRDAGFTLVLYSWSCIFLELYIRKVWLMFWNNVCLILFNLGRAFYFLHNTLFESNNILSQFNSILSFIILRQLHNKFTSTLKLFDFLNLNPKCLLVNDCTKFSTIQSFIGSISFRTLYNS